MPSPFPGMDPFLENQLWRGFHHALISEMHHALMLQVRPRYVVDIEEDVYIAKEDGTPLRVMVPDVAVQSGLGWREPFAGNLAVATAPITEPVIVTLPMLEPQEIPYLVIRRRDNSETVTVIEVLSPTNKPSRDGRTEYLAKRNCLLRSRVHLVELDLLRGGERLPTVEALPPGDYFAFVSRATQRPLPAVYAWTLEQPLPVIPIPLDVGDPDAQLNLQAVLNTTYDRAGYDYVLNDTPPGQPSVAAARAEWIHQVLAENRNGDS